MTRLEVVTCYGECCHQVWFETADGSVLRPRLGEQVAIARAVERELGNRRGQRTDLKAEGQGVLIEPELPQNFAEVKPGAELSKNFNEVKGRTDSEAAKKAGFGNHVTYRQAAAVVDTHDPALIEAMDRVRKKPVFGDTCHLTA